MFQACVCVCVCMSRYSVNRLSVAMCFMRKFFLFKKHFLWIYTKLMWNSKEPLLLDEFTVYLLHKSVTYLLDKYRQMNCIFQTNFFLICIVYRTCNIFEQKSTGLSLVYLSCSSNVYSLNSNNTMADSAIKLN